MVKQYEEIVISNKLDYYMDNSPFKPDKMRFNKKVRCIHCDQEFVFNEFKVIKEKSSGNEFIVCKYFADCNGSIIDFVSASEIGQHK